MLPELWQQMERMEEQSKDSDKKTHVEPLTQGEQILLGSRLFNQIKNVGPQII